MEIEIKFPSTDAPKYLDEIRFTRMEEMIIVQVFGSRNCVEKARYAISNEDFARMAELFLPR